MIAFNKGFEEPDIPSGYKKLLKAILTDNPYQEGTSSGGLEVNNIGDIIQYLLYAEKCKSVNFTVSVGDDGYHLNMSINKKEK